MRFGGAQLAVPESNSARTSRDSANVASARSSRSQLDGAAGSQDLLALLFQTNDAAAQPGKGPPPRLRTGEELPGWHEHHLKLRLDTAARSTDWGRVFNNQRRYALSRASALLGQWGRQSSSGNVKVGPPIAEEDSIGETVIGVGAFGTVRVISKTNLETGKREQFAVKQFRRRTGRNVTKYSKEAKDEFNIGKLLQHHNVVRTFELFEDKSKEFYQTMEFCPGGDMQTLLNSVGRLEPQEADCFFKQLINGVEYLHSMGVVHCDLKPENLLLTQQGIVKITDFGCSEAFRPVKEAQDFLVAGRRGSTPFIPPEEYLDAGFDGRAVDVWACGVIFAMMRTGEIFWRIAKPEEDGEYARYLEDRKDKDGFDRIEDLDPDSCKIIMYSMLDPVASRRITSWQVAHSEWIWGIGLCSAASPPAA
jgi:hypothetical protein